MTRFGSAAIRASCALAAVIAVMSGVGCSGGSSGTTPVTGPTPTLVTETFTGSISRNGQAVHSFVVSSSGNQLLAGFTSISPSSITSLGLGIGSWDTASSTCGLNQSQSDTAKVGSTAVSGTANSGNYCVRAYDGGNIPDNTPVTYTIQVQHY